MVYVYGIAGMGILNNVTACGPVPSSRACDRAVTGHPRLGDLPRTGTGCPCMLPCQMAEGPVSGHAVHDPTGCRTAEGRTDLAMGEFAPRVTSLPWKNVPDLHSDMTAHTRCEGETVGASRGNSVAPLVSGSCRLARGRRPPLFCR